jgi:ribosomal protein S12 methylthiotransferase accessory factor
MSEIYPVDDLAWENNSVGNDLRESVLRLPELADDACADLLDALNESSIDDQRPVAALIGLAADTGTLWEDLRVGELKTLLALACGDEEAIREGLDWILHFEQINAGRRSVYQCIDTLIRLDDAERTVACADAVRQLYGADVVEQADALLEGEQRFFAAAAPGLALKGCAMHQRLIEAYEKVQRAKQRSTP